MHLSHSPLPIPHKNSPEKSGKIKVIPFKINLENQETSNLNLLLPRQPFYVQSNVIFPSIIQYFVIFE
jgi:hypothetical protein